uniref:Uncharacterized protein n=1 Tax=Panagrolaimus davidi TaxID=227884 RepID=A0A914P5M1_9BILA
MEQDSPVVNLKNSANNGVAERAVRTFKEYTEKHVKAGHNLEDAVANALLIHRSTRCDASKLSPAEAAFGRKLRTRMTIHDVHVLMQREGKIDEEFFINDKVWVRCYNGDGPRWRPGYIRSIKSSCTFMVDCDGVMLFRHRDQIRRAEESLFKKEKALEKSRNEKTLPPLWPQPAAVEKRNLTEFSDGNTADVILTSSSSNINTRRNPSCPNNSRVSSSRVNPPVANRKSSRVRKPTVRYPDHQYLKMVKISYSGRKDSNKGRQMRRSDKESLSSSKSKVKSTAELELRGEIKSNKMAWKKLNDELPFIQDKADCALRAEKRFAEELACHAKAGNVVEDKHIEDFLGIQEKSIIELKKLAESAKQKAKISLDALQLREGLKELVKVERGGTAKGVKKLNDPSTPKSISHEPVDSPMEGTKKLGTFRMTTARPHILWCDNGSSEADKENMLPN